jgi:hypothetical protein
MDPLVPIADLDRFVATRLALHAVGEHVLCAARYAAVGRIGLRQVPGGFATPHFGDDRRLLVVGTDIVHEQDGEAESAPLRTLGEAAEFAGVALGAPTEVFTPTTAFADDDPLPIDPGDAGTVAEWFALGDRVLARWRAERTATGDTPTRAQLWPEHFDLACDLGDSDASRANYGFSPGDGAIGEPYVYVGPWTATRPGDEPHVFWDQPWGASLRRSQLVGVDDPAGRVLTWFAEARDRLG